jgi:hypothetical protein
VTDVSGPVIEPKWLSDVDILFNGRVHERNVDVETAQLEITSRGDAEEDAETGKSDDWRECLGVIDPFSLARALGNKPCLVPRDGPKGVCLSLVNPHVVDHAASRREWN